MLRISLILCLGGLHQAMMTKGLAHLGSYFTDIKSIISGGVLNVDKNTTTMSISVTLFLIVSIDANERVTI